VTTAFLHPFTRPSADDFLTIVRGEGALVYDAAGRDYVDGMASLWYVNAGHGRREIVDAVAEQLGRLAAYHTFERFTNEPAEQIAARIAATAPFERARVFLTSSGSEAVDSAVKIARLTHALAGEPERSIVVSRAPSYHGVTYAGMTLTGLPANQQHFGPLVPDVVQVPHDDPEAVAVVCEANPGRVAAVVAEPVVGAGGVLPPPDGYWPRLREVCDAHGALLVADEVITGFGRLGTWWGVERFGAVPDLMTFAKGVTSGYQPLGGVVLSRRVLDVLESDPTTVLRHGHTYSGHPACAAAGVANLEVTEREGLLARAEPIGARLSGGLERLRADGRVTEVRGIGAVWAVTLPDRIAAGDVREAMLADGVIARPIGTSTIAWCPPLVITDAQIDRCVDTLGAAVDRVAPSVGVR
jgi:putrescine---pyruvate transaminase